MARIYALLLLLAVPAFSQQARLSLRLADPAPVALGDTLTIEVEADAQGLELTSASVYITFDDAVFALVPARTEGGVQPFSGGPFLPGSVYENSTAGDAEGGNGLAGYQLNYVAVSGAGEQRSAGRGRAVLARFSLRAVGYPAGGASPVRLDGSGQRQARYTTLAAPGVARRFQADPALWVEVAGEGLVPLADRDLVVGQELAIDLASHYISQQWSRAEVAWEAWSPASEHLRAELVAGVLKVRALAVAAGAPVFYRATTPDGQTTEGAFAVAIGPAPARLTAAEIAVAEDSGTRRLDLRALFGAELEGEGWTWSVAAGAVAAEIAGGEIALTPAADWHGSDELELTLCDGDGVCEKTSLRVDVEPVNDPPRIAPTATLLVAVGERRRGPALAELVADPDHALAELAIAAAGDGFAAAEIVDGVLEIRGVAAGAAGITLRATDPDGAHASALLPVQVVAITAAPQLEGLSTIALAAAAQRAIPLGVSDADTPLEELQWAVAVEGPITADVAPGAAPVLHLQGLAPGRGVVRLTVRDPDGNEVAMAFAVEVAELVENPAPEPPPASDGDPASAPATDSGAAVGVEPALEPAESPGGAAGGENQPETPTPGAPALPEPVETDPAPAQDVPASADPEPSEQAPAVAAPDPASEQDVPASADPEPSEQAPAVAAPDPAPEQDVPASADPAQLEDAPAAAEPPAEAETDAATPTWQLGDIPDLQLAAGETFQLWLADYVVAGAPGELSWSVAGAAELDVTIDTEGRVEVRVPADFSGREVLLFRAEDGAGRAVVDAVRVQIPAPEPSTHPEPIAQPPANPAAADDPPSLELSHWPEINLVAGRSDSSLVLDLLVATGEPRDVVWSLRGGVFIAARIDARRRLHLDGAQARQGREVFLLEAQLGPARQQIELVVSVRAPDFALGDLPEFRVAGVGAELDLAPYVTGDYAPAEITWSAQAPSGLSVRIVEGLLRVDGTAVGTHEVVLTATAPDGRQRERQLMVVVVEAVPEVDPVAPVVDPETPLEEPPVVADPETPLEEPPVAADPEPPLEESPIIAEADPAPPPVAVADRRPPRLQLSGHLLADGTVEFRLVADEPLGGVPVLVADGRVLSVEARDGYYAASVPPLAGSLQVVAAASDRAGNASEAQLALSAERGRVALSPDGRVRVQGRLGAVLLYGEGEGYRIELESGSTAELVFSGATPGQGLFRRGRAGWEEVAAEIVASELYAVIAESGVYRVAKGTAAPAAAVPVAYPNPFNAEVVVRYLVPVEGPVRVAVYDALGAQIRQLVHQVQGAGLRTLTWDGRDQRGVAVASGAYLVAIEAGGERRTRKVMLIR